MSENDKLELCRGCRDDFYNDRLPGGTKRCWSLANAEVVELTKVGWWQNPPYKWSPQTTLKCHHAPGVFSWIKKDDPRIKLAALEQTKEFAE